MQVIAIHSSIAKYKARFCGIGSGQTNLFSGKIVSKNSRALKIV
jgi:hypothetical protein